MNIHVSIGQHGDAPKRNGVATIGERIGGKHAVWAQKGDEGEHRTEEVDALAEHEFRRCLLARSVRSLASRQ